MLWLRVMGLLVAAALACAAAGAAYAEPQPADGCKRAATFRVIIDVGHTEKAPGAISARGVPEFVFNLNLAKRIEEQLFAAGFQRSVLLITEGPARQGLAGRVKRAKELAADLFLSIHHDFVPTVSWKSGRSRAKSVASATASAAIPFSSPKTAATMPAVYCLPSCLAANCKSAD